MDHMCCECRGDIDCKKRDRERERKGERRGREGEREKERERERERERRGERAKHFFLLTQQLPITPNGYRADGES